MTNGAEAIKMAKVARTSHQILITTKSIMVIQIIKTNDDKESQDNEGDGKRRDRDIQIDSFEGFLDVRDNDVAFVLAILVVLVVFVFAASSLPRYCIRISKAVKTSKQGRR